MQSWVFSDEREIHTPLIEGWPLYEASVYAASVERKNRKPEFSVSKSQILFWLLEWQHDDCWINSYFWLVYCFKRIVFFLSQLQIDHKVRKVTECLVPPLLFLAPLTSSPRSPEALQVPKSWEFCFIGTVVVLNEKLLWEDNIPKARPHLHGVPHHWELQAPSPVGSCCLHWGECGLCGHMLSWNHSVIVKLLSTCWFQLISNFLLVHQCGQVYQIWWHTISITSSPFWLHHIWNSKAKSIRQKEKKTQAQQPKWTFKSKGFFLILCIYPHKHSHTTQLSQPTEQEKASCIPNAYREAKICSKMHGRKILDYFPFVYLEQGIK